MHRSKMSSQERRWRSRLCQWLSRNELLHGTVAVRENTCGKSRCKCVDGKKHMSVVLERSSGGKHQQIYVPVDRQAQVRQWVKQYQDARDLLEKVAQIYWEKVSKRMP